MAGRISLPANIAARLVAQISASRDGLPPVSAMTRKLIDRAIAPHVNGIVVALSGGVATHRATQAPDNWLDLQIDPAPNFKAPNHKAGDKVEISFSLKSGRFISSLAPSARIGLLDLCTHIWAIRAPEARAATEARFLALLGIAYLEALNEPPSVTCEEAA